MAFTIKDIPKEVEFVWALEMAYQYSGIGYGLETIQKCNAIKEKYPEWFPEDRTKEIFPKSTQ